MKRIIFLTTAAIIAWILAILSAKTVNALSFGAIDGHSYNPLTYNPPSEIYVRLGEIHELEDALQAWDAIHFRQRAVRYMRF